MMLPCMVNISLYRPCDTTCAPGSASSVRMTIASAPPMRKKAKAVTM